MRNTRRTLAAIVTAGLVALPIAQATPAMAKDGDIIRRGSCSGSTDWKLKLSEEDGRIEVEFEVDENQNGHKWSVRMKNDGARFFKGQRTTKGPSGSFEVRALANDGAGSERIVASARSLASGETCRGSATF